jgi:hypothetical protein
MHAGHYDYAKPDRAKPADLGHFAAGSQITVAATDSFASNESSQPPQG